MKNSREQLQNPKVTCADPEVGDFLLFYLNDDLTADERSRVEGHLLHCEACQDELDFFATAKEFEKERNTDRRN